MTLTAWLQLALFVALVLATTGPWASTCTACLEEGAARCPSSSARWSAVCSASAASIPTEEQTWAQYAALAARSSARCGLLVTYAILRLQHVLPLNPQHFGAVEPALAFNTAASFTTNTNWQSYAGESTMSYLTQMAGLAWHNFTSAAAGIGVALALARGLTRQRGPDGADDARQLLGRPDPRASSTCCCRSACVVALVLVAQGVIQNFAPLP